MSEWRDKRNEAALLRLRRSLPDPFPASVLAHALSRPLIPPTPRRAVESYWRAHPLRAERLARSLASRDGAPAGWTWRAGGGSFRLPPAPFRHPDLTRGPGYCCVCGQPIFRLGWHRDLWATGAVNRNATWHSACVVAWKFWCEPSDHVQLLKRRQARRCAATGRRLLRDSEVDHRVPLFEVWRDRRREPWPVLLSYWGVPNLQVVNRSAHAEKSAREAAGRSAHRAGRLLPAGAGPAGSGAEQPASLPVVATDTLGTIR